MNKSEPPTIQLVPHITEKRFFTTPKFDETADTIDMQARLIKPDKKQVSKGNKKAMRYAAYIRISSEEQVGNFSVDAQKRAIQSWVKSQEGQLVKVYIDEAQSGRSSDRPEFLRMRRDAKKRRFDALVVHKFDRFARNRTDALAIKSLLRQDYGIKVFSVTEPSEDSDGAIGALIEGIMESVADWYSRNLATETRKGKREKARQGYHNNRPPFGFDKTEDGILIPNKEELKGLLFAFKSYATGKYSDRDIAKMLNKKGYRSKTGRRFSTDTVRDMLQNRTYLGYVRYQAYARHSDGSRSWENDVEWFEGKHDAVIPEELFEVCIKVRHSRAGVRLNQHFPKHRVYLLRDIIFCAECVANMPEDIQDINYGKMRPQSNSGYLYYRCRAKDFGRECSQTSIKADVVEEQVIEFLKTLKPPPDWRDRMVQATGQLIGDNHLEDRIAEIKEIIERMDFRWDHGFITDKDKYLEERVKLQQQMERLNPVPNDELEVAADIIENFEKHWKDTKGDRKKQEKLIKLIVARVWVQDGRVVAISLRPNYHITLGLENTKSAYSSADLAFVQDRERRGSFDSLYKPTILPPLKAWWKLGHNSS